MAYILTHITFLENPFSFSVPSKLHWNLFERFFLDVHLAFTCAPASVHLTRKNAYAVVEIEDRNGSLRSPKPSFSLSGKNLAKIAAVDFFGLY